MATTFYSAEKTVSRSGKTYYLRAKCTYNISSTDTTVTASGTLVLQHKGDADQAGSYQVGAFASAAVAFYLSTAYSYVYDTSTTDLSSLSSHSSWTDVASCSFSKTLSKAKQAQTGLLRAGLAAIGLGVNPYTSQNIDIPAKTSYQVSFNANGGYSAPLNQVKWYNENLTLTSVKPSRNGFSFVKWNTAADGSGTDYLPEATYTANAPLTLYAIWSVIPTISSLKAIRCDSNGTENDSGTYAYVEVIWSCNTTVNQNDSGTLSGTITPQGGSASSITFSGNTTGSGGTATAIIPNMDTDTQYTVSVTAANGSLSSTRNTILTRAFFIMDFKAGGAGIGIGRAAPSSGLEIGYDAAFDDSATFNDDAVFLGDMKAGSTAANAKKVLPYLVFDTLAWTQANQPYCTAAVADYRPCVARFSNGAVVEFDGDPQTDSYN